MDMENKNRRELLQHIEEQNKSLQKYQTRFHDVVNSYKRLLKEKEILEDSVKLLTQNEPNNDLDPQTAEAENKHASGKETPNSQDERDSSLNSLKSNLRTLTLEKNRIETELKTDRVRLMRENDELQRKIAAQHEMGNEDKTKAENTTRELKKQMRQQQIERDKEQQNHALMLRELQCLVADERLAKEKLEQQVENLKLLLEKIPDKKEEYGEKIQDLQNQLQFAKVKLQEAESEKRNMPSLLRKLEKEMNEMKECHQGAVDREIHRANEAEEKLKQLATVSEQRAANLEQRLSELSQMVGSYDKFRQQDQIAIQKLKDRVAQLDQENTALSRSVTGPNKPFEFSLEKNLDDETIIEQIAQLKEYLRLTHHKKSADILALLNEVSKGEESNIHASCQKEINQLREEVEQHKMKEQMAKKALEVESMSEVNLLKKQVAQLQDQLQICKDQLRSTDDQFRANEQHFHNCLKELMTKHKRELISQRKEFQRKCLELEVQIQKQRERSMALLEDREKEILALKQQIPQKSEQPNKDDDSKNKGLSNAEDGELSADEDNIFDYFSVPSLPMKQGKQILHYAQELSRKDVEISNLRRGKAQAESCLRELQQCSAMKDELYENEIDSMKSQMKRLESIQSGINMEYLKNVVLRYIKTNKPSDQSHMLNAIASILHFTALELEEAREHLQFF